MDAALGNYIELIYKAMLHDPMCKWTEDDGMIKHLTNIMLFYEQQWLPKKWGDWIPTKSELKNSKWWVSKSDLSNKNKKCIEKKYTPKPELKSKAFFWE